MLIHNSTAVGISAFGATITNFQVSGKNVIFPQQPVFKQETDSPGKTILRGGVPIAVPWFGAWKNGLPRHGFLRNTLIGVAGGTSEHRVQMLHKFQFPLYPAFSYSFCVSITTQVEPGKVSQSVLVKNIGLNAMPFNPGWQPYIAMPQGRATVECGCKSFDLGSETPHIQWGCSKVVSLKTPDAARVHVPGLGTVLVTFPTDFTQVVIWSENASAVCVEPVLGPEKDFATSEGYWIEPGVEERFHFSLELLS